MSAPARLFNQLRETLGEEPARDLIAYIAEARAVSRGEVRDVAELYLSRLAVQHKELLRWLFAFWAGTIIPLAGLMIALSKL
jgi:hypothetical protein